MIVGPVFGLDATTWALSVAVCCGVAMSEVGELVSSIVASASASASRTKVAAAAALVVGDGAT